MEAESNERVDPKTIARGKDGEDSSKRKERIVMAIAFRARRDSQAYFVSVLRVDSSQRPDH